MRRYRDPVEKTVSKDVRGFLELAGFTVSSTEGTARRGGTRVTPGLPDLYVQGHGVRFWVELKTRTGRVRDSQEAWHAVEVANGGAVFVWRGVADAVAWWNDFKGRKP